jgi:hypothetical protein
LQRCELCNGHKSLVIINALYLSEAIGNEVCFVFLYSTIGSLLYVEHPFAADNLASLGVRYDGIDAHALKRSFLLLIGHLPFYGINPFHGLSIGSGISQMICLGHVGLGMAWSVRYYFIMQIIVPNGCLDNVFKVNMFHESILWEHTGVWFIMDDGAFSGLAVLFEHHILGLYEMVNEVVHKTISAMVVQIPKESTREGFGGELVPVLLWDMDICSVAEDPKVSNIGFISAPCLFRCHIP